MSSRTGLLGVLLIVAVVHLGLRLPTVVAGRPYLNYVDEGFLLHSAAEIIESRTWDPGWYIYPSTPMYAIAAVGLLTPPVASLSRSAEPYYDLVGPFALLVLGRLVVLAVATATSVQIALMARRLMGNRAAMVALWFATLLPALVARSAVVNVDFFVTLFVLLALDAADRARLAPAPGPAVLIAAIWLGLAATSKYPAALAACGVVVSLLSAGWSWRQRLGAVALLMPATALVAALAMPALVLRTEDVWGSIRVEAGSYERMARGSYIDQALFQAEWDLPMRGPELGIVFVLAAIAGLVLALARRRWRPTFLPWLAYGVPLAGLLSAYSMRPFRNVLPLAAVACVLVGLLAGWLGERSHRRWVVDVAAAALPVVLFAPQLTDYVTHQLSLEDSRVQAIDWLRAQVGPQETVVVSPSLAVLPQELERLGVTVQVPRRAPGRWTLRRRRPRFVLSSESLERGRADLDRVTRAGYRVRQQFGEEPTPDDPLWWRGNRQIVYVLERAGP